MAADRAQVWFRPVIAELRESWRPDLSWNDIVELRDCLQRMLDEIVEARDAARPSAGRQCSCCGGQMRPVISVRAVILATGRFGIETDERVRHLDKEWTKYRKLHSLDMDGRAKAAGQQESGSTSAPKKRTESERAGEQEDGAVDGREEGTQ